MSSLTRNREELQAWYREAMRRRIAELGGLRARLQAEERGAFDDARSIGQRLRGSGATFGFPHLTAVATLLETSSDADVLRRVEGLISELHLLVQGDAEPPSIRAEWLHRAADLPIGDGDTGVATVPDAWDDVALASGLTTEQLAAAVARYLEIGVADVASPGRSALRLVPEALMTGGHALPLRETESTIVVATAEPTSLALELELRRVTGRTPLFEVAPPERLERALTELLDTRPAPPAPVRPALDEPVLDERGVLVVDDEPSARFVVRSLLEKRGFDVVEAEDGLDALDRLAGESSVGLVVADLNMPNLDGLELIWELRGTNRWAHLPVIVVTGAVDEILETQLLEEGASDYIRKPVDPRLFLARVEATLRRQHA